MKISGEAQLKAGVAEVYAALQDPAVLVRTNGHVTGIVTRSDLLSYLMSR